LVWTATVFLFYSAATSKRSVYILPLYPAVALLLGAWWQELRQGRVALPRAVRVLLQGSGYVCFGLVIIALTAVLAQLLGYDPLSLIRPLLHPKDQSNLPIFTGIISTRPLAFLLWFGVVGPSALVLVRGVRSQYWGQVFAALVAFTISTFLLVNNVFQPALGAARTFRPFMPEVVAALQPEMRSTLRLTQQVRVEDMEAVRGAYDLVVAMYHDQGHIPTKLIAFDETVNVSLGLPIRRTSVDHGTAFDIAWKGKADHTNMRAAVAYARMMAERMPARIAA
jgi:hypothetical protein